jgi:hypothetical protein
VYASWHPDDYKYSRLAAGVEHFLGACGILDFDVAVTGPQCFMEWNHLYDVCLMLALPIAVTPHPMRSCPV